MRTTLFVLMVTVSQVFATSTYSQNARLSLKMEDATIREVLMEIENKEPFTMQKGDFFIVKKGLNHRVSSTKECSIMLIENKATLHTGTTKSEITKSINKQLDQS